MTGEDLRARPAYSEHGELPHVDITVAERDALADLIAAVGRIPRHYPYDGPEVEDVSGKCLVCGTSWPCSTELAGRTIAALDADA